MVVLLIILGLAAAGYTGVILSVGDREGGSSVGAQLERLKASPQWSTRRDCFANKQGEYRASFFEMSWKYFLGGQPNRQPKSEIPIIQVDPNGFAEPPESGLRITWLGHSTYLIEIGGIRALIDPVWAERASPFTWAGPQRFYQPPLPLSALPEIDVILISHDHYDHLDYETVLALKDRDIRWMVPLGVGAHLESWGVPNDRVSELDWWESRTVSGVQLTATPARHFSGRSVKFNDKNATLWAGWALKSSQRSVFYSGDTGLHPAFKEIGERLGPFDLTLMETGAYNSMWPDVHLGPEQAVLAHQLVRGRVMMPAHWGLFDLAMHSWTEPAERVIEAAKALGESINVVRPGGTYDIASAPSVDRFWPAIEWQKSTDDPVWSTEVTSLQSPLRGGR